MQKNFYVLCMLLLTGLLSQAQIKKGDILLGGDVNLNVQNNSQDYSAMGNNQTYFGLTPSIGKFVNDRTLVGFQAGWLMLQSKSNNTSTTYNKSTSNTFSAGVFIRKYKPLGNQFYVFLQSSALLSYNPSHSESNDDSQPAMKTKVYGIDLGLAPGIAYAFNDRLMLELSFQKLLFAGYQYSLQKTDGPGGGYYKVNSNNTRVGTGLNNGGLNNLSVGFRVLLGHKA